MYALKPGFLDRLEVGVNLGLTNIIQREVWVWIG